MNISIQLASEQERLIRRAAERSGLSVSEWALSVLLDAASDELGEFPRTIRLDDEAWDEFSKALEEPMPKELVELLGRKPAWG